MGLNLVKAPPRRVIDQNRVSVPPVIGGPALPPHLDRYSHSSSHSPTMPPVIHQNAFNPNSFINSRPIDRGRVDIHRYNTPPQLRSQNPFDPYGVFGLQNSAKKRR